MPFSGIPANGLSFSYETTILGMVNPPVLSATP
jgi:hypothetical protein